MATKGELPEILRATAYVAVVTLIIGAGLFLLPPFGVMPVPCQLALTSAVVALWCYLRWPVWPLPHHPRAD
jgi:hypothetical protein